MKSNAPSASAKPAALANPGPLHTPASLARRLRLQQFMIFTQVVQAGSILAASRELAMTQPAVSKSIHDLEAQLGGALFMRGKRGVVLTEFGSLFEQHVKTMMGELRYLAEDLNSARSGTAGHVVVGTLITASATLLPEAIQRLRRGAPDVVVTVRVGPNSMLFPSLVRGELDVVVGVLPDRSDSPAPGPEPLRLVHVPLYHEALRVVVGSQHPLARRRKLTLAELQEFDWIIPTPDSAAYASVRSFFDDAGLALPRRRVESVSILTNIALVSSHPMVALMTHSAADRFSRLGLLSVLPINGLRTFGAVGYTVRADREPTAVTRRFLAVLHEVGLGFDRPK